MMGKEEGSDEIVWGAVRDDQSKMRDALLYNNSCSEVDFYFDNESETSPRVRIADYFVLFDFEKANKKYKSTRQQSRQR